MRRAPDGGSAPAKTRGGARNKLPVLAPRGLMLMRERCPDEPCSSERFLEHDGARERLMSASLPLSPDELLDACSPGPDVTAQAPRQGPARKLSSGSLSRRGMLRASVSTRWSAANARTRCAISPRGPLIAVRARHADPRAQGRDPPLSFRGRSRLWAARHTPAPPALSALHPNRRATAHLPPGCRAGRLEAMNGAPVTIGRAPDAALVVDDPGVSWHHARIARSAAGAYYAQDLGSTTGTYLRSVRIGVAPLHGGDLLQLGPHVRVRFALLRRGRGEAPPTALRILRARRSGRMCSTAST